MFKWRPLTRNLSAKLLSFFFAIALWLSVTNQIDFEQEMTFPIEYVNRPENLTTIQALPDAIRCQVRGKGRFLRYTLRDALCRIDLSGNQAGLNTITVGGSNLVLPSDARVARVDVLEPKRILAEFDETVIRDIPITPTVVGVPAAKHVQVGKTFVNPASARVRGPRKLVDQIALVSSDEVDIAGTKNTVRKKVKLLKSFGPTVTITPEIVEIGITVETMHVEKISRVTVEVVDILPDGLEWSVQPESVSVRISGARSFVDAATKKETKLLLSSASWEAGTHDLTLRRIDGRRFIFAEGTTIQSPSPNPEIPGPVASQEPNVTTGEITLPPDLEVVAIEPDRLRITIQRARISRESSAPNQTAVLPSSAL